MKRERGTHIHEMVGKGWGEKCGGYVKQRIEQYKVSISRNIILIKQG